MAWIGHGARALLARRALLNGRWRVPWFWGALGWASAVIPAIWLWGFTVDDALIAVRYARHLAQGQGYRFNVGGPSTDGVTPLPWPFVLAPIATTDPGLVLVRAKLLGLAVWSVASCILGIAVGRGEARLAPKLVAMLVL